VSDDAILPLKWVIPSNTVILPNDYIIIWTDNDTLQTTGLHTNFKLGASGDYIRLSDGITIIDQVTLPALLTDQSYARCPETGVIFDYAAPTFDAMNNCFAGVESISFEPILYPNPASDIVNLMVPNQAQIEIMDMNGKSVYVERDVLGLMQLTTTAWTNGLYLVIIRDYQGETHCLKLIKQ
jgi:hypothetical protein